MPHQLLLKYLSSKTSFVFNKTLYTLFREICRNGTFKRLLKTLLKELFTNKGEILSCKSVKPCKNRKNSRAYYVRTRDKSGSNSSPFKRNVQIPPSPSTMHSQMPGVYPGGGMLKFRIHRRITLNTKPHSDPHQCVFFFDILIVLYCNMKMAFLLKEI